VDRILFGKPVKLRIPLDEDRFDCVGRLDDGTQFMAFGTGCFPDGYVMNHDNDDWRKVKRWIAVLHLFDSEGRHFISESRLGGYDIEGWEVACGKVDLELRKLLGPLLPKHPKLCDIYVQLFSAVLDGVTHSLFYGQSEEDPKSEWVMLEPRDIMFHPPWDSGEYST
jgi:hypothetical protein